MLGIELICNTEGQSAFLAACLPSLPSFLFIPLEIIKQRIWGKKENLYDMFLWIQNYFQTTVVFFRGNLYLESLLFLLLFSC